MSITVEEKWGRKLGDESAERGYVIFADGSDEADDIAVRDALIAATAATYDGLDRQPPQVEEIDAGGAWIGIVRYGPFSPIGSPQPGDDDSAIISFDTGGVLKHVSQSLETIASYAPAGEDAPDFGGAINVVADANGNLRVEGADIDTSDAFLHSETHAINDADMTTAYKGILASLKGHTNDAPFKDFAAGEALFLGAVGQKRSADTWEITFRFAGRPNQTGRTIGDITGIDAEGWHLVWVFYEHDDQETSVGKFLVIKPRAAYVERIFDEGDFSTLGIGT